MKKNTLTLLALLATVSGFSQNTNIIFRSKMTFPGQTVANVWGYSTTESEYALIGASKGLIIADITDPDIPVQIVQIPGPNSLWKEIRTYGHYAYVVTEGGGGIQIVDLNGLPSPTLATKYYTGDGPIQGQLGKIHALHIDETQGFLYAYGGGMFNGGAKVFDLKNDPYNPTYVGKFDQLGYIHDGYVDNDTMYAGHINSGRFSVVDMTDKANPVLLATQNTPNNFTHNTWLSNDRKTLFTTDETANSFLAAYDVSDPGNIRLLDKIQSNPGSNVIVHNTMVLGNFAITSWYKDGFTIVDISRPDNLVQVGNYDTYPTGVGSGFEGCWGAYPYFPSGNIIASTMSAPGNIGELWVLTPTYVRACYLEGSIVNGLTGNPLSGATISIVGGEQATTQSDGTFKMGQERTGYFTVRVSRTGYEAQEYTVYFQRGDVRVLNISLYPSGGLTVDGQVVRESDGTPVPNATVSFFSASGAYSTTSGQDGAFSLSGVPPGLYDIAAGAEGYGQTMQFNQKITADKTITLTLSSDLKTLQDGNTLEERTDAVRLSTPSVWPNPFSDAFWLALPAGQDKCRIQVTDLTGKLVEDMEVSSRAGGVLLGNNWPGGTYLVRVTAADLNTSQTKVIKIF
ncbi:MAG: choice-of-anchor B family protein [Saprospiraceae bacterium]|jgi:choice-of-anchor B domain-containing protein|nr:choice-of-anchor B family protein [Saprospiraceae bacterium]